VDLIEDIHAQARRRVFRRAGLIGALTVALLLVGLAFKIFADRTARGQVLETARGQFALGSLADIDKAAATLEAGLSEYGGDDNLASALALVRVHAYAEFGERGDEATAALADVSGQTEIHDAVLATGIMALVDGDWDAAQSALSTASALDDGISVAPAHEAWLSGMLALAQPERNEEAMTAVVAALEADGSLIAYHRLLVGLHVQAGDSEEALAELGRTREQSFVHKGLAADEALYNALLRQRLGGVASVAEQLLADTSELATRDEAHATLARAVVHVQSGELESGLENLERAWAGLPRWDTMSRNLALELAMEARAGELAREWAEQSGLGESEQQVYEAWALLNDGDIMKSLAILAALDQKHPRVAYLQGLALVEQGRFEEAGPWLERADKLIPGRVELDVALARVELRTADKTAALRKLKGLAEEEPYAPRAWTGLGEAYLEAEDDGSNLAQAKRALERALEREHRPAEAMLLLAEVWDGGRKDTPEAPQKARELLEQAAQTNPSLPKYRERLALYLAEAGHRAQAVDMLQEVIELEGIGPETMLALCRLAVEQAGDEDEGAPEQLDAWLALAEQAGAAPAQLERERARAAVVTGSRKEAEAAHETLAALLEAAKDDTDLRVLYSRSLLRMFEREKAITALRRGLQLAPEAKHGFLYLEWARIEARTGSRRKASSHARVAWNKMLLADHTPAELLDAGELATVAFLRDKKPRPAVTISRTLSERVPYHARAWTVRARAQLADKQIKEASESAQKAIALDDSNPRAHRLYGDSLLRQGYRDKAKASYERALELSQEPREKESLNDKLAKL
jgi:tetratricopeptide (TPR) repeat protein